MQHAPSFDAEESFLPFLIPRERILPATLIRSTWLGSSVQALRERQLFDRYIELLPEQHHAAILEAVAGVWLPMQLGVAHYEACNQLGLSRRQMWDIGVEVTCKVHGTTLGLAIRLAKQTGATPWSILAQLRRLWERIYQGGDVAVSKRGPKEAVIDVAGWPLAPIGYVRHTMPAVVLGIVEMFCHKAYVSEAPGRASPLSLALKVQWV